MWRAGRLRWVWAPFPSFFPLTFLVGDDRGLRGSERWALLGSVALFLSAVEGELWGFPTDIGGL